MKCGVWLVLWLVALSSDVSALRVWVSLGTADSEGNGVTVQQLRPEEPSPLQGLELDLQLNTALFAPSYREYELVGTEYVPKNEAATARQRCKFSTGALCSRRRAGQR